MDRNQTEADTESKHIETWITDEDLIRLAGLKQKESKQLPTLERWRETLNLVERAAIAMQEKQRTEAMLRRMLWTIGEALGSPIEGIQSGRTETEKEIDAEIADAISRLHSGK